MEELFGVLLIILLISVGIALYFLPTIIARKNQKENFTSILLLNIFLGWALVGWVIALVWATSKDKPAQQIIIQNHHSSESNK